MQKMAWEFGELEKVATDEGFIWYAELKLKSESFGEVPFCLVSADTADVGDETISLARRITRDIDRYVKDALAFCETSLGASIVWARMSLGCLTCPFAICRLGCRNARFTRAIRSG